MYIWVPMLEEALDDSIHIEGGSIETPPGQKHTARHCCVLAVCLHLQLRLYHLLLTNTF
jgi:hypothetical protein